MEELVELIKNNPEGVANFLTNECCNGSLECQENSDCLICWTQLLAEKIEEVNNG